MGSEFSGPPPSPQRFKGPPHECWYCGGRLAKGKEHGNTGTGCLIVILGLVLSPVLIGIPILLYGVHLSGKAQGHWRCRRCDSRFPRKIRWYELG